MTANPNLTQRTTCRMCQAPLADVLDLGVQVLGGQFPRGAFRPGIYKLRNAIRDPEPPAFPLVLARCSGQCGLMQLRHTVNPELMFRRYGYRSGVTATMREHLAGIAREAERVVGKGGGKILDIGGNDGWLLSCFGSNWDKSLVDPSDIQVPLGSRIQVATAFWPLPHLLSWGPFDLIFSVACFYASDDPLAFARCVRENLTDDGVWCVEVADAEKKLPAAWDDICHEHLLYFTENDLRNVARMCGFRIIKSSLNSCNGWSIRHWLMKLSHVWPPLRDRSDVSEFAADVRRSRAAIHDYLEEQKSQGRRVHLLGASTKANTWLQYCGVGPELIQAASDRDSNKKGCRTPGTGIPILSEEQSRLLKPDVYIVGPWQFRQELMERERAFLERGGRLCFPLPKLEEVTT